jgi:CubicO group peptidase (beta-lactamase class C family)
MRRRRFSSLLGGTALASLAGVPAYAQLPESCGVPGMRADGWATISVDHDKLIDGPALCEATDRLVASGANIHSVLVARGGQLVFERYFKGPDELSDDTFGRRVANVAFDADALHDVKSVSKSVASLAVGIAIDRGLIRSVNEPIFSFFPELSDLRTPEKDRILLLHALDMTMGLEWVEATPETGDFANDEARMHMAADQCRYVLSLASDRACRTRVPLQHWRARAGVSRRSQGHGTPSRRIRACELVRSSGHFRGRVAPGSGGYGRWRRIAPAAARHGQNWTTCPRGRSLERPPSRF